jgi:hypothetical protein
MVIIRHYIHYIKYMGMRIGLPQNFLYYRRLLTLGSGCFCM